MKTIAIIQARLGSTRCPKKVIREIEGKPLIRFVVERVAKSNVDDVIVAVPVGDIEDITNAVGLGAWRVIGINLPEDDVAGRFTAVLEDYYPCDTFVRICGDSPLIDPALIDEAVASFKPHNHAVMHNPNYPHGQQVEVVDTETFLACEPKMKGGHREHVTSWFYERPFPVVGGIKPEKDYSDIRMVVDTEGDL